MFSFLPIPFYTLFGRSFGGILVSRRLVFGTERSDKWVFKRSNIFLESWEANGISSMSFRYDVSCHDTDIMFYVRPRSLNKILLSIKTAQTVYKCLSPLSDSLSTLDIGCVPILSAHSRCLSPVMMQPRQAGIVEVYPG